MKAATRSYRLGARAETSRRTRERILDAVEALAWKRDPEEITLEEIAGDAGVTLQTVLRKFGSKDALFEVAIDERGRRVAEQRTPPAADPRAAVAVLVASYEAIGDGNWRMLRREDQSPTLHKLLTSARALHRGWIAESFARELPASGAARERMIDALFTVLDFYVWKLQRKDLGRSRAETEALMLGLVAAVIGTRRAR